MAVVKDNTGLIELLGYKSEDILEITDKNTGEIVRELPKATDKIISRKLDTIETSKELDLETRIIQLKEAFKYIRKHIPELAELESQESGIPFSDFYFRWGSLFNSNIEEYATLALGEDFRDLFDDNWRVTKSSNIFTQVKPLGTLLNITPNNDNVGMGVKTLIDIILSGSKVLYKPGSKVPSALINIVSMLKEYLPGYIDIFVGDTTKIYNSLSHPSLQGVVFVGKSEHGKQVQQEAIKQGVHFVGEYEGTNINYICKDASLSEERILRATMSTRAWNGIACANPHITTIENEIYSSFLEGMIKQAEYINSKIGNSMNQETLIGPVITSNISSRYETLMDIIDSAGQKVIVGGELNGKVIPYTLIEGLPFDLIKYTKDSNLRKELSIAVTTGPIVWVSKDFNKVLQWHFKQTPSKVGYNLRTWIESSNEKRIREIANIVPSSMIVDDVFYFPNGKWTGLGRTSSTGSGDYLINHLLMHKSLTFAPKNYDPFKI